MSNNTININVEKFNKVSPYIEYDGENLYEVLEVGDKGSTISRKIDKDVVNKIKFEIVSNIIDKNKDNIIIKIESLDTSTNIDREAIINTLYNKIRRGLKEINIKHYKVSIGDINLIVDL